MPKDGKWNITDKFNVLLDLFLLTNRIAICQSTVYNVEKTFMEGEYANIGNLARVRAMCRLIILLKEPQHISQR